MSRPALDPVIHSEARLRVTATLAALPIGDAIAFPRLQALLGLTAGNLSAHLTKLEQAGYVDQTKTFRGRTPATYINLTAAGRAAFDAYQAALREMLQGVREDPD